MVRLAKHASESWSIGNAIDHGCSIPQQVLTRFVVATTPGDEAEKVAAELSPEADEPDISSRGEAASSERCVGAIFFGATALLSLFMRFPVLAGGAAGLCLVLAVGSVQEQPGKGTAAVAEEEVRSF